MTKPAARGRRLAQLRKQRRETVYKMQRKRHYGKVPCFVCGQHVEKVDATLEHVVPRGRGGSDSMSNLAISHDVCNKARGCPDVS